MALRNLKENTDSLFFFAKEFPDVSMPGVWDYFHNIRYM